MFVPNGLYLMNDEEPGQDQVQSQEGQTEQASWNGLWSRLNLPKLIRQEGNSYFIDPKSRRHYMRYLYH